MKIGTKSLFFGCHQIFIHPIFTFLGWVRLYGFRSLTLPIIMAIIIHDWGYLGCHEMDGPEGSLHPLGLKFLHRLPAETRVSIKYHSRHLSRRLGMPPSRLCWADKMGTGLMPSWLWAVMARMSGEGWEYVENPYGNDYVTGKDKSLKGLVCFHKKYKKEWGPDGRQWEK